MRIRFGFPTTSRLQDLGGWSRAALRYAARPRRAPPGPMSPSTSIARPTLGHDDLAGPRTLRQSSGGRTEEPLDIKRRARWDSHAPSQHLGDRVLGVGAVNMAGFDARDGSPAMRDQHRLPAPNLAQQSAESVFRFTYAGSFHLAIMALLVLPVKRRPSPTPRQEPRTLLLVVSIHPPTCQPPPENPS